MKGFTDYFLREMSALRAEAAEAVKSNPALAPFLQTPGRDADVEKILESFAFLAARLRVKLDDELPEFTHGLFAALWPSFLRPQPATTILRFSPTANTSGSNLIPKGTFVESIPVDGLPCTFRTVYDTEVLPLRIDQKRYTTRNGNVGIAIRFSLTNGVLGNLPLSRLRLFFSGDEKIASSAYFSFLRQVRQILFVVQDDSRKEIVTSVLEPGAVRAVGFADDEPLFPFPETLHPGYRLITEYFCFPQKFQFLDICGLETGITPNVAGEKNFELRFEFLERPRFYEELLSAHWNLFCTPIVNLFPLSRVQLNYPGGGQKMLVLPDADNTGHFSVFSLERVLAWPDGSKDGILFHNAGESFSLSPDRTRHAYRLHVEQSILDEDVDLYMTVPDDALPVTRLEVDMTCTNGKMPEKLGIGDIRAWSGTHNQTAVEFKNILPLSDSVPPPIQGDLLWKLLSNFTPNILMLKNPQCLGQVLAVYNFRALYDSREALKMEAKLAGIKKVTALETDRIFKGYPIRGLKTTLLLSPEKYASQGEMYLFGAILNEFLAILATAGSFHQLEIQDETGNSFSWPARFRTPGFP
jgi:type VI secretion system protein ImpG